jgi:2-polyprenyl-6-methoxyphenol hydroxylase-like FAD-dependent oxidoreductase
MGQSRDRAETRNAYSNHSCSEGTLVIDQLPKLFDVIIVGNGISGAIAATVLGRAGYEVCVIDRHAVYPPDFRAEHLAGPQVAQLRRLVGLHDLTRDLYHGKTVAVARFGRIVAIEPSENYGLRYEALVARARGAIPASVCSLTGRVAAIEPSDNHQRVFIAGGRALTARLVIIATGHGYKLCGDLEITRQTISRQHSVTFGFDISPLENRAFPHSYLVHQRGRIQDRIDYLAAFRMGPITRVNLFSYRRYGDAWSKALQHDPRGHLADVLPGFEMAMGAYQSVGPVVARPMDIYTSAGYECPGAVLIGDAFQSACPATGDGLAKLLTDIEQLCTVHIPRWFSTPGMAVDKVKQFYRDPIKMASDAEALHDAHYRRLGSTETGLQWRLHRLRVHAVQRLGHWWNGDAPAEIPSDDDPPQETRPSMGVQKPA